MARKSRKTKLHQAPQDREEWQRLYYKYQKSYQRRRLLAIKYLWDGYSFKQVCQELGCDIKTLRLWIDSYLAGGFTSLLTPKQYDRTEKLSERRKRVLKFIILHKLPSDYGYDSYTWTLALIQQLIQDKWAVHLSQSRLHAILHKDLNLSFQKFHRDYQNADPAAQKEFARQVNEKVEQQKPNEALLWFDEFSASTRPNAGYSWAEKNTSPTIASDEKKENAIMPC